MNQFRQTETERKVLTPEAVAFLIDLENEFGWRRSQLLARKADDEKLRQDMLTISEQAQRASDIVNELMDFAKPDPPQRSRFSIAEAISTWTAAWAEKHDIKPDQISFHPVCDHCSVVVTWNEQVPAGDVDVIL